MTWLRFSPCSFEFLPNVSSVNLKTENPHNFSKLMFCIFCLRTFFSFSLPHKHFISYPVSFSSTSLILLPTIAKCINCNTWKFKFWTQMWQADSYGQGCRSEAVNYKRKFYLCQRKMMLKFTL